MIAIKTALLTRKLLAGFFRLLAGFFRLLFGSIFYKILAKIYYQIFRWRKIGLIKNSPLELLWKQPVYFFIFTLVILIFISNLTNTKRAGVIEMETPNAVMSNLVQTEFSVSP